MVVHGNCQSHTICSMLSGNKEFLKYYITIVMPRIWEEDQRTHMELMLDSGIFDMVDYLFTQEISKENRFWDKFSSDFLKSLVPEQCKIVMISNLFFMGYFPRYRKMRHSSGVNFFRKIDGCNRIYGY